MSWLDEVFKKNPWESWGLVNAPQYHKTNYVNYSYSPQTSTTNNVTKKEAITTVTNSSPTYTYAPTIAIRSPGTTGATTTTKKELVTYVPQTDYLPSIQISQPQQIEKPQMTGGGFDWNNLMYVGLGLGALWVIGKALPKLL